MTLKARVEAPDVRPAIAGFLDIAGDPLRAWSGPRDFTPAGTGDSDFDGQSFGTVNGAVEMSQMVDDMGTGEPASISWAYPDNAAPVVKQIVRDNRTWQLRRAKLRMFFVLSDDSAVHPESVALFSGRIVNARTARAEGAPPTITLTLDQDLALGARAPARILDHPRFAGNTADTFGTFIAALARGPLGGAGNVATRAPTQPGSGGGTSGSNVIPRPV